jgi:hypothetical protein
MRNCDKSISTQSIREAKNIYVFPSFHSNYLIGFCSYIKMWCTIFSLWIVPYWSFPTKSEHVNNFCSNRSTMFNGSNIPASGNNNLCYEVYSIGSADATRLPWINKPLWGTVSSWINSMLSPLALSVPTIFSRMSAVDPRYANCTFFGGRQKTRKSNDFTLKFSVLIHQITCKMILMKTIVFVQSKLEKFS